MVGWVGFVRLSDGLLECFALGVRFFVGFQNLPWFRNLFGVSKSNLGFEMFVPLENIHPFGYYSLGLQNLVKVWVWCFFGCFKF